MKKQKEVSTDTEVTVNTNPKNGPLDGASAIVNMIETVLPDGEHSEIVQSKKKCKLMASYELGVCSITSIEDNKMFTVRIDEMMQVLFHSASANTKLKQKGAKPKDGKES